MTRVREWTRRAVEREYSLHVIHYGARSSLILYIGDRQGNWYFSRQVDKKCVSILLFQEQIYLIFR